MNILHANKAAAAPKTAVPNEPLSGLFRRVSELVRRDRPAPKPAGKAPWESDPVLLGEPTMPVRTVIPSEELGTLEPDLRGLLGLFPQGGLILNDRLCILAANPAAERIFGYLESELRGCCITMLFGDFGGDRGDTGVEHACLRKDGSVVRVQVLYSAVMHESGSYTVVSCEVPKAPEPEAAELQERIRRLEGMNRRLRESMAEVPQRGAGGRGSGDELYRRCAQSLRQPLEAIRGGVDDLFALLAEMPGHPRLRRRVDMLREETDAALEMTSQLRDLTVLRSEEYRHPAVRSASVDLGHALQRSLTDLMGSAVHRGCALTVTASQLRAPLNPGVLGKAVRALTSSALREAADGSRVSVTARSWDSRVRVEVGFEPTPAGQRRPFGPESAGPAESLASELAAAMGGRLCYEREIGGRRVYALEFRNEAAHR